MDIKTYEKSINQLNHRGLKRIVKSLSPTVPENCKNLKAKVLIKIPDSLKMMMEYPLPVSYVGKTIHIENIYKKRKAYGSQVFYIPTAIVKCDSLKYQIPSLCLEIIK